MILLFLLACSDEDPNPFNLDGPVAAAVLPGGVSAWDEPVGFVANQFSGKVVPLDLKEGRLLTDDPSASFLRAAPVALGRERSLVDVAVVGDDDQVRIWAIDARRAQLLAAPYVVARDAAGHPVEVVPTATDPVFVDADGSGDAPSLTEVRLTAGNTTTEDWSIEYDGERWWAKGSRSGTQTRELVVGELWWSDHREIEFRLDGEATLGDRFEIRTETGVDEWVFEGGVPAALQAVDTTVLVSVTGDWPAIHRFDGLTGAWRDAVALPEGATPGRMTLDGEGAVWVADTAAPAVYRVWFDTETPVPVETLATAGPVIDLAWSEGEGLDGTPFGHLFVAPLALQRVDVWDPAAGAWVDPNPLDDEVAGVWLGEPVTGLAASTGEVWLQQETAWGARPRVPTVVVTGALGHAWMLEGETGCGVEDEDGAYGPVYGDGTLDGGDYGNPGSTLFAYDEGTGEQVVTSSCGGVTRSETWSVTYDSASLSWVVEGSESGVQAARAVEDRRYVSDTGAISFLLLSGALPPSDGDRFEFQTRSGLINWAVADVNHDGEGIASSEGFGWLGRPATYHAYHGPTGGGWDKVDRREYALVVSTNTDVAASLWLDEGATVHAWQ